MFCDYNFRVVRALRRRLGLTMEQLAQKSGVTYPTVAAIETNKSLPSMKTLDALAGALEVSASNLLTLAEHRTVQIKKAEAVGDGVALIPPGGSKSLKVVRFDKEEMYRVRAEAGEEIPVKKLREDIYELCYVLSGSVSLKLGNDTYTLIADDSIIFDGVFDHTYSMVEAGEFLVVHIPKVAYTLESIREDLNASLKGARSAVSQVAVLKSEPVKV